jgi:two-component system sensor histidine kinase RegB
VALIAAGLHHSGGEADSLAVLSFVPMTIAAATLPFAQVAAVFVAIFALHEVVCHYLPGAAWPDPGERRLDLLAGGLVSFFVYSMARTSRLHEELLAKMREKYLEQRHLADLGSVAAAAVHEISSPLATLAVAVGELRASSHAGGGPSEQQALLEVMARQIDGCKHVASRLLAASGQERAESGGRLPADRFVAGIVEKCRLMQPWMALEHRPSPALPVPEVMSDQSIEQAILVLLHSSPGTLRQVELAHSWDARHLRILLSDYGPVSSISAEDAAGTPLFAAQPPPQSKHFDLLMAKAAIERFGGHIDCRRHSEGAFCMELCIPLPDPETTKRLHAA